MAIVTLTVHALILRHFPAEESLPTRQLPHRVQGRNRNNRALDRTLLRTMKAQILIFALIGT